MSEKSFFTETEHWTEDAQELDAKLAQILRPIFKDYIARGYSAREVAYIISNVAMSLGSETILGMQHRAYKEKQACLQKNGS
jgi:hypothetical protein